MSASGPPSVQPVVIEPSGPSAKDDRRVGVHLPPVGRFEEEVPEPRPDPRRAQLSADPGREEGVDAGRGIALGPGSR